ncbi:MAG: hypothetical protein Tsb0017_12320 [Geothermobacteraceae bacterium]
MLLVRQLAGDHPQLQELLDELPSRLKLDGYQLRQRLVGWSLGMLARGGQDELEPAARLLARVGVRSWLVPEPQAPPAVDPLRAIEVRPDAMLLCGRNARVAVDAGIRILAVLGDVSGHLAQRQLKQLMAARIYQGRDQVPGMDVREKLRTIWQGKPLLDLYLFDERNQLQGGFRVRPGGFNPAGLGEAKQPGAAGNMRALMALLKDRADRFVLDTDFGLAQIAGCQLCGEKERDDWLDVNTRRLLRYGSIRAAMLQTKPVSAPRGDESAVLEAAGPLGVLAGQAVDLAESEAGDEAVESSPTGPVGAAPLPQPPPENGRSSFGISWGLWLFSGGLGIWAALAGTVLSDADVGRFVSRYGFETGILPAILALILLTAGLRNLRLKRLIETTPTSRIRSLAMGLVELHGTVRREFALVAPMTQTPCAWYRVRRYRRRRNHKNNQSYWQQTSVRDSGHVPFLLDDGTGRVRIDPAGATVIAGRREEGYPGQGNILMGASSGYDADEKWVEERIDEGTRLYVLGSATPVRSTRQPLRVRLVERLRQLKGDQVAMRRFDRNGDGHIDDEEWQAARSAVERELLEESLHQETERGGLKAIIGRGHARSLPFVIAEAHSEDGLTRKLAWLGWLLTAAAGGVFVWALTLMVA